MVTMNADYLTCGQCLKEFPLQRITLFIQHKKLDCDDDMEEMKADPELRCNNCPQGFMTAWALLVHAQLTHNLKIFLENASKTVLKEPDLPGKDNGALLPAKGSIKTVEASKTCQGEHAEPIPVDQKPAFQTDAKQSVNGDSGILVTEERDKSFNVLPQLKISPQSTAEHCVKMGSNITIAKNIISNIGKEPIQTQSPEKNVKKISPTENKEPVWTNQRTNISQPSNIYQVFPSSVAIVQNSNRTPFTLSKGQIVNTNNMKVLPAVKVNRTSKDSPSTQLDRDDRSALVPQPRYSEEASTDVKNVTKNSQSNLPSAQPFPGLPLCDKQPKLDHSLSEDNSLLNRANNVDMEIGKTKEPGSSEKQCLEEVRMDVSSQECCDSQDCGVKVIPGSHEHLKKCCNAVVPKKRKRHMELKHMPFAWSSSRYASRKLLHRSITSSSARSTSSQFLNKASSNTIYIDLEPDSMACSGKQGQGNDETSFKVTRSSSAVDITTNETSSQMPTFGTQSKQRSLILKPCSVFSIPLTYAIPTSQTASYVVTPPKSKAAKPLVELKLEPGSSILPSSTCGTDENQTTLALQQANTLTSSVVTVRNNAKVIGRSRQPLSKPFKCDNCPSAFNQRIHLQKHMSKHTGIKPYKCGECNYATVERSHLKVHIRIHTGEKPFKCTYCEYATAQNSTLKIHLKRHHGGKMFHCRSCDKQFTQKEQLEVHEWEHGSKEVVSPQLKTSEDVKFLIHTEDFNQDAGTNQLANQMFDDSLKKNCMFDDSL